MAEYFSQSSRSIKHSLIETAKIITLIIFSLNISNCLVCVINAGMCSTLVLNTVAVWVITGDNEQAVKRQ